MKVVFTLPDGTLFEPSLEGYHLFEARSGEFRSLLIDRNFATWEVIADAPPVEPPPTPPPTLETELYVVVATDRLNVRKDHSRSAEIMRRLNPGEEFPVIKGVEFDDTDNAILWRKTIDSYWVAVKLGSAVYAQKVDTSTRGG